MKSIVVHCSIDVCYVYEYERCIIYIYIIYI